MIDCVTEIEQINKSLAFPNRKAKLQKKRKNKKGLGLLWQSLGVKMKVGWNLRWIRILIVDA